MGSTWPALENLREAQLAMAAEPVDSTPESPRLACIVDCFGLPLLPPGTKLTAEGQSTLGSLIAKGATDIHDPAH